MPEDKLTSNKHQEFVTGDFRWLIERDAILIEWQGHGAALRIPKVEIAKFLQESGIVQSAVVVRQGNTTSSTKGRTHDAYETAAGPQR